MEDKHLPDLLVCQQLFPYPLPCVKLDMNISCLNVPQDAQNLRGCCCPQSHDWLNRVNWLLLCYSVLGSSLVVLSSPWKESLENSIVNIKCSFSQPKCPCQFPKSSNSQTHVNRFFFTWCNSGLEVWRDEKTKPKCCSTLLQFVTFPSSGLEYLNILK